MTVGELITLLAKYPTDYLVVFENEERYEEDITQVRVEDDYYPERGTKVVLSET